MNPKQPSTSSIIYDKRGGGRVGSFPPRIWSGRQLSWPFCRLTMRAEDLTLSLNSVTTITLKYTDIETIKILRNGYIAFKIMGDKRGFAFAPFDIKRVVLLLQKRGCQIPDSELAKLPWARASIWLSVGLLTLFIIFAVWVYLHPSGVRL